MQAKNELQQRAKYAAGIVIALPERRRPRDVLNIELLMVLLRMIAPLGTGESKWLQGN